MMRLLFLLFLGIFLAATAQDFSIESLAFSNGGFIPVKYTCDGADISPPLKWKNIPKETKSFVLIMDDPDAPFGTFTHWIVYDIPSFVKSFPENFPKKAVINGIKQGINDFGKVGYGGPCPPHGKPHRYFFKLFALDIKTLHLPPKATRKEIETAIKGHIIQKTYLMGRYKRR